MCGPYHLKPLPSTKVVVFGITRTTRIPLGSVSVKICRSVYVSSYPGPVSGERLP